MTRREHAAEPAKHRLVAVTLDEGSIGTLHPVRVEDQVVSYPEGIEPEAVGEPRPLDQ